MITLRPESVSKEKEKQDVGQLPPKQQLAHEKEIKMHQPARFLLLSYDGTTVSDTVNDKHFYPSLSISEAGLPRWKQVETFKGDIFCSFCTIFV